jgi:hypothetical protein
MSHAQHYQNTKPPPFSDAIERTWLIQKAVLAKISRWKFKTTHSTNRCSIAVYLQGLQPQILDLYMHARTVPPSRSLINFM